MKKSIVTLLALAGVLFTGAPLWADDANHPQNMISVVSPPYCSDITGTTTISIAAPGLSKVTVKCWKQGDGFGSNSTVGNVDLDDQGNGTIDFPADDYPHGPITVVLTGSKGNAKDTCYLQLYNKGGVSWNEGIPKDAPPAAEGMTLVFADDFNQMPSIGDGHSVAYYDHKPPDGSQDFSFPIHFASFGQSNNPFSQVDSYLRIRADAKKGSTGLISSLRRDGTGVTASIPSYFECRFIAPDAVGTWPAFWLLSAVPKPNDPGDELDIIEAYGGDGPGSPNAPDLYRTTPHAWNQGPEGKKIDDAANVEVNNPISMHKVGVPSTWAEAFHIYGCKITDTETTYYLDNIEVSHHKTMPMSKKYPFYFLINLATGGGWPVNLSRYGGKADMYVDYVRVYSGAQPGASSDTPSP